MGESGPKQSRLGRLCDFFLRPSTLSLAAVVAIGMISGLVFWGGFNTGMEATNTLAFCTGCHEMRDTVFQEYKETIHYRNRSGVRAICSDCHVPKDWLHKFVRKIQASQELYGKFVSGVVDTPEKFEAHRMELAQNVWATMKASDSRECRNCHSWDAMDVHKQQPRARAMMEKGQKEGKTCIDCHKGIAHLLPKEYTGDED
ncbi:MAG TPA: NapC/NirT family cytochrome c [Casimicrobiaceae bacterium]